MTHNSVLVKNLAENGVLRSGAVMAVKLKLMVTFVGSNVAGSKL